jgi:hypothetical protein
MSSGDAAGRCSAGHLWFGLCFVDGCFGVAVMTDGRARLACGHLDVLHSAERYSLRCKQTHASPNFNHSGNRFGST